jgi:hypothetical protein
MDKKTIGDWIMYYELKRLLSQPTETMLLRLALRQQDISKRSAQLC